MYKNRSPSGRTPATRSPLRRRVRARRSRPSRTRWPDATPRPEGTDARRPRETRAAGRRLSEGALWYRAPQWCRRRRPARRPPLPCRALDLVRPPQSPTRRASPARRVGHGRDDGPRAPRRPHRAPRQPGHRHRARHRRRDARHAGRPRPRRDTSTPRRGSPQPGRSPSRSTSPRPGATSRASSSPPRSTGNVPLPPRRRGPRRRRALHSRRPFARSATLPRSVLTGALSGAVPSLLTLGRSTALAGGAFFLTALARRWAASPRTAPPRRRAPPPPPARPRPRRGTTIILARRHAPLRAQQRRRRLRNHQPRAALGFRRRHRAGAARRSPRAGHCPPAAHLVGQGRGRGSSVTSPASAGDPRPARDQPTAAEAASRRPAAPRQGPLVFKNAAPPRSRRVDAEVGEDRGRTSTRREPALLRGARLGGCR